MGIELHLCAVRMMCLSVTTNSHFTGRAYFRAFSGAVSLQIVPFYFVGAIRTLLHAKIKDNLEVEEYR